MRPADSTRAPRTRWLALRGGAVCLLGAAALSSTCSTSRGVRPFLNAPYPERLSAWRLFVGPAASLQGNTGVLPYDLNTPLFSDYADKHRTVWIPPGQAARTGADGAIEFPVGTVFTKTFHYRRLGAAAGGLTVVGAGGGAGADRLLVETRLLFRTEQGWVALPYVWNAEQSEATLEIAGGERRLAWRGSHGADEPFDYVVPNTDQCASCHVTQSLFERALRPLGPTLRNLNRAYAYTDGAAPQIERWRRAGYLAGTVPEAVPPLPAWDDEHTGDTAARARAYLEVQCAHCHGPGGPALSSGLDLSFDQRDPLALGICKTPVAAGRGSGGLRHDVVPGRPDQSILLFRMLSREPDVMMPELGRSLRHEEGIALVRLWIAELPGRCD